MLAYDVVTGECLSNDACPVDDGSVVNGVSLHPTLPIITYCTGSRTFDDFDGDEQQSVDDDDDDDKSDPGLYMYNSVLYCDILARNSADNSDLH